MTDAPQEPKKPPDYNAYFVPHRENAFWTRIGALWTHEDGEGFNLDLQLMPNAPGRIVIRRPKAKEEG